MSTTDDPATVMDNYFTAMGQGQFSQFFTDDVTWTTIETGVQISGPRQVQDAIIGLHARMPEPQTSRLIFGDGAAFLEGRCSRPDGQPGAIAYCVSYDIADGKITAMRAYGAVGALMPTVVD